MFHNLSILLNYLKGYAINNHYQKKIINCNSHNRYERLNLKCQTIATPIFGLKTQGICKNIENYKNLILNPENND